MRWWMDEWMSGDEMVDGWMSGDEMVDGWIRW